MRIDAHRALIPDLLHSCANPTVARAALLSIGGGFAERVRRHAEARDMSAGVYAALSVAEFARQADEDDLDALGRAIDDADLPLLEGLRLILDRAIGRRSGAGIAHYRRRPDASSAGAACRAF